MRLRLGVCSRVASAGRPHYGSTCLRKRIEQTHERLHGAVEAGNLGIGAGRNTGPLHEIDQVCPASRSARRIFRMMTLCGFVRRARVPGLRAGGGGLRRFAVGRRQGRRNQRGPLGREGLEGGRGDRRRARQGQRSREDGRRVRRAGRRQRREGQRGGHREAEDAGGDRRRRAALPDRGPGAVEPPGRVRPAPAGDRRSHRQVHEPGSL